MSVGGGIFMSRELIGFCGRAGSGKDSAAAVLVAAGWTRVAFADGVKEMAYDIDPVVRNKVGTPMPLAGLVDVVGWDRAKELPDVRRFLQRLGTEGVRRHLGDSVWVDLAAEKIDAVGGPVVVTDVRFPNEVEMVRLLGGVVVRVERPGVAAVVAHSSETAVDGVPPDLTLLNDGDLEQLARRVNVLAGVRCGS